MTKTEPARRMDALLMRVVSMRDKHPQSAELNRAHAKLLQGLAMERKLYSLPILGAGFLLFGAYVGISSGDVTGFGILAVIGALAALSFFPIRSVFRWEARKQVQKVEKLLAELPGKST